MRFFPSHLQIETVNRICNARCTMCTIDFIPETSKQLPDPNSHNGYARDAEIMPLERYIKIIDKFSNYTDYIKYISLHGCGEPLLDQTLASKVAYTKSKGFRNVGFTSNCHFLSKSLSEKLLKAGLNCIIPSIDGHRKETHEAIRGRTDFTRIQQNVEEFLQVRNKLDADCKVVIRMVRQQLNKDEWEDYKKYWDERLDPSKGDACVAFDIHNTGGKVSDYENKKIASNRAINNIDEIFQIIGQSLPAFGKKIDKNGLICLDPIEYEKQALCPDLFTRLSIYASGRTALCSADQSEYHPIGSVLEYASPEELFNSTYFEDYRKSWMARDIKCKANCKECTITVSRFRKHVR